MKEIDFSFTPHFYFLKPKRENLALFFILSLVLHGLLVGAYFLIPESRKASVKPQQKGMGSMPIVIWSPNSTGQLEPYKKSEPIKPEVKNKIVKNLKSMKFFTPEKPLETPSSSGFVFYPAGSPLGTSTENKDQSTSVAELLNEDEFMYSSFFSRLRDNLYPLWVRKVRSQVDEKDVANIPAARTRLRVRVDESGLIQKVEQLESSGCSTCDTIALDSVLSMGRVTHPPQGFKQRDGLYDFKLSFTIYTQYSRAFIEFDPESGDSRPRVR